MGPVEPVTVVQVYMLHQHLPAGATQELGQLAPLEAVAGPQIDGPGKTKKGGYVGFILITNKS